MVVRELGFRTASPEESRGGPINYSDAAIRFVMALRRAEVTIHGVQRGLGDVQVGAAGRVRHCSDNGGVAGQ